MGRVLANLVVSNFGDILANQDEVRRIEIKNALVDTGAAMLSLQCDQIAKLGLRFLRKVSLKTANGPIERNLFGVAQVEIEGRMGEFDVVEVTDDVPVLIGYIVLEQLDFVVNPSIQRLIPNPANGGKWTLDLY
jgi:predicted aspartyl protease